MFQNTFFNQVRTLRGELTGAVATTLVSLPLSMTIGVVAFAPLGKDFALQGVMAGLFGAITIGFVATVLGTKSLLISGPRASSALILASLMTQLFLSDALYFPSGETVQHVISIAYFSQILGGAVQLFGGAFRFGNIVKYIPYPVISGFVNSSALLIIMSQSWVLFDVRKESTLLDEASFLDLLMRLNEAQPLTMIPGLTTIAVMILVTRIFKKIPASLAGMVAGTAVYYALKSVLNGVDIGTTIGSLSETSVLGGAPQTGSLLPTLHLTDMFTGLLAGGDLTAVLILVIPAALSMAMLASLETAVSLSTLEDLTNRRQNLNPELARHGLGNMIAAMFGGLFSAGDMIRTKPGLEAGGKTALMAALTSAFMLLAVIFFGQYIAYIPRAVIAGMIMVLGFQIFDRWSLKILKNCFSRFVFKRVSGLIDIIVVMLVIAVALTFDLIVAVGIGTLISIVIFVSRMSRSLIRNIYYGPAIRTRNIWPPRDQARIEANGHKVAVVELEGSIFFGTASNLEHEIDRLMQNGVIYIILDTKRVTDIDITGYFSLQRIQSRLHKRGGTLSLSYILKERRDQNRKFYGTDQRKQSKSRHLWTYLKTSGAVETLGEANFFPDTDRALTQIEEQILSITPAGQPDTLVPRSVPTILKNLTALEIRTIRRRSTRHVYSNGETIFNQGDAGDAIYYVSRGRADIILKLPASGEFKRLHSVMSGTVFGEMAVLDNRPRAASVVATKPTICYRLASADFEEIKANHGETALKLFNNICLMFSDRIRHANALIAELEK